MTPRTFRSGRKAQGKQNNAWQGTLSMAREEETERALSKNRQAMPQMPKASLAITHDQRLNYLPVTSFRHSITSMIMGTAVGSHGFSQIATTKTFIIMKTLLPRMPSDRHCQNVHQYEDRALLMVRFEFDPSGDTSYPVYPVLAHPCISFCFSIHTSGGIFPCALASLLRTVGLGHPGQLAPYRYTQEV